MLALAAASGPKEIKIFVELDDLGIINVNKVIRGESSGASHTLRGMIGVPVPLYKLSSLHGGGVSVSC